MNRWTPPMRPLFRAAFVLVTGLALRAPAVVVHEEILHGELSGEGGAPTPLVFGLGSNEIVGTMGAGAMGLDADFFRFTIDPGLVLDSIEVVALAPVSGSLGELGAWLALAEGTTIATFFPLDHLSNALVRPGDDALAKLADGAEFGGAPGFATPLGAGTYAVWIQETAGQVDYHLDFAVAAVPEPASTTTLLLGLTLLAARRRAGVPGR